MFLLVGINCKSMYSHKCSHSFLRATIRRLDGTKEIENNFVIARRHKVNVTQRFTIPS